MVFETTGSAKFSGMNSAKPHPDSFKTSVSPHNEPLISFHRLPEPPILKAVSMIPQVDYSEGGSARFTSYSQGSNERVKRVPMCQPFQTEELSRVRAR
jgi:hypothetical protein